MVLTDRQKAEIRAAYRGGGVGLRPLAARYGVSHETIRKVCVGIVPTRPATKPSRSRGRRGTPARRLSDRATAPVAVEGDLARIPLHDRAGAVIAHATVDAEDADRVGPWRWLLHRRSGTPRRPARRPDGRWGTSYLRREILGLEPSDGRQVIHLNGDPLDCRRANLRAVTVSAVAQRRAPRRGSSPYRNVRFHRRARKWQALVTLNRRRVHLGLFDDPAEAARVAADWRREHMPYADGAATPAARPDGAR